MEIAGMSIDIHIIKNKSGKIKIKGKDSSQKYVNITIWTLTILTILGFATFDYKGLDILNAIIETLVNMKNYVF